MRFFFFNDTATTEIYTLSLHDALPIYHRTRQSYGMYAEGDFEILTNLHASAGVRFDRYGDFDPKVNPRVAAIYSPFEAHPDRKSTRLNSSHLGISYAVFCLKKKNQDNHKLGSALDEDRTEILPPEERLTSETRRDPTPK